MCKYLQSLGLLDVNDPIGELNLTFDNCPGKNNFASILCLVIIVDVRMEMVIILAKRRLRNSKYWNNKRQVVICLAWMVGYHSRHSVILATVSRE